MRTIYKYKVETKDSFTLDLPSNYNILTVQLQYDEPQMWIEVDTDNPLEKVEFRAIGTGNPMKDVREECLYYIGTYQLAEGRLVFHLFEVIKNEY